MSETEWQTVGFTAAPEGWRVEYRNTLDSGLIQHWSAPIAGWLRQESYRLKTAGREVVGAQRVIAAVDAGQGELRPVDTDPFGIHWPWSICGPGQAMSRPDVVE